MQEIETERWYVRLNFSIPAVSGGDAEMQTLKMLADAGITDSWEIEKIEPEED